jgi:hypothetical protein
MQIAVRVAADAPLLDQIDPVFGWTGVSHLFPSSWQYTAGEVLEKLEQVSEAALKGADDWLKSHKKRIKRL